MSVHEKNMVSEVTSGTGMKHLRKMVSERTSEKDCNVAGQRALADVAAFWQSCSQMWAAH